MSSKRPFGWLLIAFLVLAGGVFAHVRLIHPSSGSPLYWAGEQSISITFNSTGSGDITDGSHMTALHNAVDEWNSIPGTTMRLIEDSNPVSQARTDWGSDSLHMIIFDETNSSGYFPTGSGTVAITPVWFYSNGRIADADVLFNGKGFGFTTEGVPGRYDVQDVAVHELGHLVGLDHSGWAGASMYPYVDPSVILHRSLSKDEVASMRMIYPNGSMGRISGTVRRVSNNSVVKGGHVVARDSAGRPTAAVLTNNSGNFSVGSLTAGTYSLYVTPLDYPVASFNLGTGWTIQTDFESTEFGNVTIGTGQHQGMGTVLVDDNVSLSLGRNTDPYPLRCPEGETTVISVRGSGLNTGSTLSVSDASITVTPMTWFGNRVTASVTVPDDSPNGHLDLMVINGTGDRSILAAALEVTPPDPTVTLVSPNQGDFAGGASITLFGTDFKPGARVVMGGEVYEDGATNGCTVVNDTTIQLTTRAGPAGLSDVVVIDPSGVEGRMSDGFQFIAVPVITTLYPESGSSSGGTIVQITGENFSFDTDVRIDGVNQGSVFAASDSLLVVVTEPGPVAGPLLVEVENIGGSVAASLFSYYVRPDPVVTSVTPNSGDAAGGQLITIDGSQFGLNLRATFGADPNTGEGGVEAAEFTRVDANTIEVVTPPGSGVSALILEDEITGQATVVSSGYTYIGPPVDDDGGGGSCQAVPVAGPPDLGQALRSLLWFLLVAIGIRVVGRPQLRSSRVA